MNDDAEAGHAAMPEGFKEMVELVTPAIAFFQAGINEPGPRPNLAIIFDREEEGTGNRVSNVHFSAMQSYELVALCGGLAMHMIRSVKANKCDCESCAEALKRLTTALRALTDSDAAVAMATAEPPSSGLVN